MEIKNIDITKTYTTIENIYCVEIEQKKYLKYFHSNDFSIETICKILVFSRNNELKVKREFNLPISDYNKFEETKNIPICFYLCNLNNVLVCIQNSSKIDCKLISILDTNTLVSIDSFILHLDLNFNEVIFNSQTNFIEMQYLPKNHNVFKTIRLKIDKNEYDFDDNEFFENLSRKEEYLKEYEKLLPQIAFLPYTIFTPSEWDNIINNQISHLHLNDNLKIFNIAKNQIEFDLKRDIQANNKTDKNLLIEQIVSLQKSYNLKSVNDNKIKHNNYKTNNNDWLRNASGTDDPETMNDVYWNID